MSEPKVVKKGSLIRIWHVDPKKSIKRGHLYVPIGHCPDKQLVYLMKANSFNNDGTIHKAVKKYHRALPYTKLGGKKLLKGVTYIDKQNRNIDRWVNLSAYLPPGVDELKSASFVCHPRG